MSEYRDKDQLPTAELVVQILGSHFKSGPFAAGLVFRLIRKRIAPDSPQWRTTWQCTDAAPFLYYLRGYTAIEVKRWADTKGYECVIAVDPRR